MKNPLPHSNVDHFSNNFCKNLKSRSDLARNRQERCWSVWQRWTWTDNDLRMLQRHAESNTFGKRYIWTRCKYLHCLCTVSLTKYSEKDRRVGARMNKTVLSLVISKICMQWRMKMPSLPPESWLNDPRKNLKDEEKTKTCHRRKSFGSARKSVAHS